MDDQLKLIVPVYNEAENFPSLVREVERHVPAPYTLYMVYDAESDTTLPVARDLARTRPWLVPVRNESRGVVAAMRTGFRVAGSGPTLVVMADLSDDLRDVAKMLELYGGGARIVCGSRYSPGGRQVGGPRLKALLSRTAGWSLSVFAGFPTRDATNNFRLYDAELVNRLGIRSTGGWEVALELTARAFRAGEPITEVPTVWRDRTAGESRFRLVKWLPRYVKWYGVAMAAGLCKPFRFAPAGKFARRG